MTAIPRRARSWVAMALFALVYGGGVGLEVAGLFVHQNGVPITRRGDRPRVVGEIAGETGVAQTFTVNAGGFSGISVEPRPYHERVAGDVIFTLHEIADTDDTAVTDTASRLPIARVVRRARDVVANTSFHFAFPTIEESEGRRYRLDIRAPGTSPGLGLGLWATRGQAYRGGLLTVAGVEQWGDLVFRVHAIRATLFGRFQYALRDKPTWLRSRLTLGVIFVLYNWALGVIVWQILVGPTERTAQSGSVAEPDGG